MNTDRLDDLRCERSDGDSERCGRLAGHPGQCEPALCDVVPARDPGRPVRCLYVADHKGQHSWALVTAPLSALTLAAVQAEAVRAHLKHGPMSLLNPEMSWHLKLAALVEEVGEVAHELTHDQIGDDRTKLVRELLQVASVALTWVESIEGAA